MNTNKISIVLLTASLVATALADPKSTALADASLRLEADRAMDRGLKFLAGEQMQNGSWRDTPGITAMVIMAHLNAPRELTADEKVRVEKGFKFIVSCAKPTGAIFTDSYASYNTSICLLALVKANDMEKYGPTIKAARRFLLDLQLDEGENVLPKGSFYGGIGYGSAGAGRPDVSNTHLALEAIRFSEMLDTEKGQPPQPGSKLHWDKAVKFLERSQNLPAKNGIGNDQSWAGNDGGFVYKPDESKASLEESKKLQAGENVPPGSLRSYPSMTYAGFKSYIYAELKKDDPRVQAAYGWIQSNWDLEKNGSLGMQGYYYYLHTLAKALDAWGEETITDSSGKTHSWRRELAEKLLNLQRDGGFWVNDAGRWEESDKVLATAFSLLALQLARGK